MEYLTTINFGGFYGSFHEDQLDQLVAYSLDGGVDEQGEIDHDLLYDFNEWGKAKNLYCKEWLNLFNYELGTDLIFREVDSPRYYNFKTDVIIANISNKDVIALLKYVKDNGLKSELKAYMIDQTTSKDGFHAFYSYADLFGAENRDLLIQLVIDIILRDMQQDYPLIIEELTELY